MKHSRNEVGIAKPTSIADRVPSAARTTIITSAMAVRTEPSSWRTMPSTCTDWSSVVADAHRLLQFDGPVARTASTVWRTRAAVSMMLKPCRLTTCSATVVSPLKRAVPVPVLEGQADLGQFAQRHDPVAVVLDGEAVDILAAVSKLDGILTEIAPDAVSTSPAAISWLLFTTALIRSCAVTS
jgi:hypothetical protein